MQDRHKVANIHIIYSVYIYMHVFVCVCVCTVSVQVIYSPITLSLAMLNKSLFIYYAYQLKSQLVLKKKTSLAFIIYVTFLFFFILFFSFFLLCLSVKLSYLVKLQIL